MDNLQDIIDRVRRLPPEDRIRLVKAIQEPASDESGAEAEARLARRLAAMRRFALRAGTGHSEFLDVSQDKYKHLSEIHEANQVLPDEK